MKRVAYFVMRYPALTQTFLDREMRGLIANGFEVEVHPVWDFGNRLVPEPGGPRVVRPAFLSLLGRALLEAARHPGLVWRGVRAIFRHRPRFAEGWFMCLWGGVCALGQAAELRRAPVDWLHGAWATAPATVALSLALLLDRPFSFGAHAYDLHRHGGDPLLPLKLQRARFVHTTTASNVEVLRERFSAATAEIVLARRGLPELPPEPIRTEEDWRTRPVRLLSVGRLVEKKGQHFQLALLAELNRRSLPAELTIIGEGPLRNALETQARALGVNAIFAGALAQEEVQRAYAAADIFLHTGIVDAEGDRDGLPNVVPEAMAAGVCVISSPGGGAAEAIVHEATGLIADPRDPAALAAAVERLRENPPLRIGLRRAARAWVEENFLASRNAGRIGAAIERHLRGDAAGP